MSKNIDPTDKSKNLELMRQKLETMLSKTNQELHSLEVEWLHLRSLALKNVESKQNITLVDIKTNFDDINEINSQQFLNSDYTSKTVFNNINSFSENESEED